MNKNDQLIKVSVIVCVYNAAKTLSKCLDSILTQSLEEIEIIAINDGSTDNSLEILNDYARCDNRLIIINQKNSGPFEARRGGVERSKGKYITFCDSDDWLEYGALEAMYNATMAEDIDIIIGRHYTIINNNKISRVLHQRLLEEIKTNSFEFSYKNYELIHCNTILVAKLFKSNLIKKATSLVEINTRNGEDRLVLFMCYFLSKNIRFIYEYVYTYYQDTPDSLIKKRNAINDNLESWKKF